MGYKRRMFFNPFEEIQSSSCEERNHAYDDPTHTLKEQESKTDALLGSNPSNQHNVSGGAVDWGNAAANSYGTMLDNLYSVGNEWSSKRLSQKISSEKSSVCRWCA